MTNETNSEPVKATIALSYDEFTALQMEVEELRRDKVRLDWMEGKKPNALCLVAEMDDDGRITATKWEINDEWEAPTLREAIDAVMDNQP